MSRRASTESCPVCGDETRSPFYRRRDVPVHENMVYADRQAARGMDRGTLALVCCPGCGFIYNAAFDPAKVHYDADYDNTQTCSEVFRDHVESTAREMVEHRGVRDATVVEVGCGSGDFIRRLVAWEGAGNRGWGFDPSYAGPLIDLDGKLRFRRSYYGPECAEVAADVVVSRHMIEHVPDPVALFRVVHAATASSDRARLFVETRTVEWALDHASVWDFVYEACSYFTAASLRATLGRAGFDVTNLRHAFADQYLFVEAERRAIDAEIVRDPGDLPARAEAFGRRAQAHVEACRGGLVRRARHGAVAIWGAGTKGMTFANIVDPDATVAACAVDLNPAKQGGFLPGTGHAIVAPGQLRAFDVGTVICMNPRYRDEIAARMEAEGIEADLVGIAKLAEPPPPPLAAAAAPLARPIADDLDLE